MRKVTATAIGLGTFVAGALLGFGVSNMFYHAKLMAYEMIDIEYISNYVTIQHYEGTPQAYEIALRDYLSALNIRERAGPGPFSENALWVDRAMTYARLALLAADRKDLSAASTYRSQAEAQCPHLGWKSCSADEITKLVRRLDEHSIWNPSRAAPEHGS
jgi:hypothetical protein